MYLYFHTIISFRKYVQGRNWEAENKYGGSDMYDKYTAAMQCDSEARCAQCS